MSHASLSPDIIPFILSLVNQSRDVFWIRSPDYSKQLYINPAYEVVWGRSRESLYADPSQWMDTIYPEDLNRLLNSVQQRTPDEIKNNVFFIETYRIVKPDGEIRWIKDNSTPIYDQKGIHIGFAGIAQDITDDKKQEEMIIKAKEMAEAASFAKTEFIRNMSHDIRTPLTGIIGMAEMINRTPDLSINKDNAENIQQAGRALLNLLNEIIETTQLESGDIMLKKSCFELKETVNALVAIFKPTIKYKGLKLEIFYDDNIPQVLFGQELLLHRIILNLLGNAVKFTEKGAISLEVSLLQKKTDKVSLKLVIKDTGIGIPEGKHEIIFDKFSRLTSSYETSYKGSGLGLYMVKEFIKKLGGDIKVNSTLGRGAQFICTVQFKMPTTAQLKKYQLYKLAQESFKPHLENENKTAEILLVEDNELVQKTTVSNFKSWGYDFVDVASTGLKAIEKTLLKKYDLIYLDLGLPDLQGVEVAKNIRNDSYSANQHTPIIALTAHADEGIRKECKAAQINKLFLKPLLEDDFRRNVAEFITHQQPIPIIDWSLWEKRSGNNPQLAKETQQIIFKELPQIKNKTGIAFKKKNRAEFNHLIHQCYGELVYCGLPALESVTAQLLKAIQEKQQDQIESLYQNFCLEIERVFKK